MYSNVIFESVTCCLPTFIQRESFKYTCPHCGDKHLPPSLSRLDVVLLMKCLYRLAQSYHWSQYLHLLYHCQTQEDTMIQIFTVWMHIVLILSIILVHLATLTVTCLSGIMQLFPVLTILQRNFLQTQSAVRNQEGGFCVQPIPEQRAAI